jgi:hypothetical protein
MLTRNRVNPLQAVGDIKDFTGSVVWFLLWADNVHTVAGLEWAAGAAFRALMDRHAAENGSIAWEAYALLSLIKPGAEPRISNPRRVVRHA